MENIKFLVVCPSTWSSETYNMATDSVSNNSKYTSQFYKVTYDISEGVLTSNILNTFSSVINIVQKEKPDVIMYDHYGLPVALIQNIKRVFRSAVRVNEAADLVPGLVAAKEKAAKAQEDKEKDDVIKIRIQYITDSQVKTGCDMHVNNRICKWSNINGVPVIISTVNWDRESDKTNIVQEVKDFEPDVILCNPKMTGNNIYTVHKCFKSEPKFRNMIHGTEDGAIKKALNSISDYKKERKKEYYINLKDAKILYITDRHVLRPDEDEAIDKLGRYVEQRYLSDPEAIGIIWDDAESDFIIRDLFEAKSLETIIYNSYMSPVNIKCIKEMLAKADLIHKCRPSNDFFNVHPELNNESDKMKVKVLYITNSNITKADDAKVMKDIKTIFTDAYAKHSKSVDVEIDMRVVGWLKGTLMAHNPEYVIMSNAVQYSMVRPVIAELKERHMINTNPVLTHVCTMHDVIRYHVNKMIKMNEQDLEHPEEPTPKFQFNTEKEIFDYIFDKMNEKEVCKMIAQGLKRPETDVINCVEALKKGEPFIPSINKFTDPRKLTESTVTITVTNDEGEKMDFTYAANHIQITERCSMSEVPEIRLDFEAPCKDIKLHSQNEAKDKPTLDQLYEDLGKMIAERNDCAQEHAVECLKFAEEIIKIDNACPGHSALADIQKLFANNQAEEIDLKERVDRLERRAGSLETYVRNCKEDGEKAERWFNSMMRLLS